MRVGRDREDLDAERLELTIQIGQVFQLGWADESEVSRVEEEDRPFTFDVSVRMSTNLPSLKAVALNGLISVLISAMVNFPFV